MSDDRDGLETLSKAIDDVANRLPPGSPRRRTPARPLLVGVLCLIAVAAVAAYRLLPRQVAAPAAANPGARPASLGVEVMLLRVRGRDVDARVFDAGRAGAVVVAPAVDRPAPPRPLGVVGQSGGGVR